MSFRVRPRLPAGHCRAPACAGSPRGSGSPTGARALLWAAVQYTPASGLDRPRATPTP